MGPAFESRTDMSTSYETTGNADAGIQAQVQGIGSLLWLISAVIFGLIGPIALSVYYAGVFDAPFARNRNSGYPWRYPVWAYGITLVKLTALVVWMSIRNRPGWVSPWLAGTFAGIFIAGSAHAAGCAAMNTQGLGHGLWFGSHVVLAGLASLCYFWSFVAAALKGRHRIGLLLLGVLLGLVTAAMPLAAELGLRIVLLKRGAA